MAMLSDAELAAQLKDATRRGAVANNTEPRAVEAHYDGRKDEVVITLRSGATIILPRKNLQGLCDASADQLRHVELLGEGYALRWPELDADFTVPGLASLILGTRSWMASLGGRSRSEAKAAAARANGSKGGRPRKNRLPPERIRQTNP